MLDAEIMVLHRPGQAKASMACDLEQVFLLLACELSCRAVLSEGRLRVVPGVVVVHRETHAISCCGHIAECQFMLAQFASCGRGTSDLCFVPSCFVALQSARSEWRLSEDLGFPAYHMRECRPAYLEAAAATCCFYSLLCQIPRQSQAHELHTGLHCL